MPRIIRVLVACFICSFAAAAQELGGDCVADATVHSFSVFSPSFTTIRIKLPIPFRLAAGIYFDAVFAIRRKNDTWTIILSRGDHDLGSKTDLNDDDAKKQVNQYCPGLGDKLDEIQTEGSSAARGANAAIPAAGQASQYFVVADFDGDGIDDVAGVDNNTVSVSLLKADLSARSTNTYKAGPGLTFIVLEARTLTKQDLA